MKQGSVLDDRVALITGAGGGIGGAVAHLFSFQGARVALLDHDLASGQAVASDIREAGGEALFVQTDVTDAIAVEAAFQATISQYGALDVLVNVVGVSGRRWGDGPVDACTEEAWDRVMEINLKSVFLCCKYGLRAMLDQGRGAVVNISSVLGLVGGDKDFATHAYAATKGGIISLTRAIATYYAPQGIRANVICPGLIATPMSRRAQEDEALRVRLATLQPLTADFGRPEDVAQAALYLGSDQSSFVTGAVLTVDGGWTAQ